MREEKNRMTARRILVYGLGIVILALGIDLNTKASLGVSPIISVPYSVARISGWLLGAVIFVYYMLLILLQALILRRDFSPFQILQVPCAFLTSFFVQIFDGILPTASGTAAKFVTMVLAIFITGLGAGLTVTMKIVPNPADGLADVIGSRLLHRDYSLGKNVLDLISIGISALIGWGLTDRPAGIGVGTVMTMIFTGRVVALLRGFFARVQRWAQAGQGSADHPSS